VRVVLRYAACAVLQHAACAVLLLCLSLSVSYRVL
jgi:hypothetical protein